MTWPDYMKLTDKKGGIQMYVIVQICTILFLLNYYPYIYAQKQPKLITDNCVIEQYNTDNGLPSNSITGMAWQESGNLIMTTEAGIVCFDGLRFYIDTLDNRSFFRLIQTPDKKLIAYARGGNLYEIRNKEICQYFLPKTYGNDKSSLIKYTTLRLKFEDFFYFYTHPLKNGFMWNERPSVYPYKDYLISNEYKSIYICDKKGEYTLKHIPKNPELYQELIFINEEPYLIDSKIQLFKIFPEEGTLKKINIKNYPFNVNSKEQYYIYDYGQKNPIIQDKEKAWILKKNEAGEIEMEFITDCIPQNILIMYGEYIPELKILILGTQSNGLWIIRKNHFSQVFPEVKVKDRGTSYYLQLPMGDGRILTNHNAIIGKPNGNKAIKIKPSINIGNSWYKDSKGNLWYCHLDSIFRYNTQEEKIELITNDISAGPEKTMFTEFRDTIYAASANGLIVIVGNRIINNIPYPGNIKNKAFPGDIEIYKNKILISTCRGLFQYNTDNKTIDRIFDIPETCMRDIYIRGNTILLATYGKGIYRIHPGKIEKLPLDKAGYLDFSHCFIEDKNHNLWISSNRGIFKIHSDILLNTPALMTHKFNYYYYGLSDGVRPTELNGGCTPCAIKINSQISFPSMDGLIQFNPDETPSTNSVFDFHIEEIKVNETNYSWRPGQEIVLEQNYNNLSVNFSYPWWSNPLNLHIAYRIKGYDNKIIKLNYPEQYSVIFNHLPPGKYVLEIFRIDFEQTNKNSGYISIPIHIKNPWFSSWWGIMIIGISGTTMILLVINIRIDRIEKQKRKLSRIIGEQTRTMQVKNKQLNSSVEKLRKSQVVLEENNRMKNHVISILSHDLVTPLKYLSMAGRGVIHNPDKYDKESLLEMIEDMVDTAQQLEILTHNILSWIKYFRTSRNMNVRTFDLHELVNRQQEPLIMFFQNKHNKFHNQVPEGTFVTQIHEPLGVIIFNLISNANKYTKNGDISVDFEHQGTHFMIYISDTGSGIPQEKINRIMKGDPVESSPDTEMVKGNGLGYLIIRELLTLIKGELTIESELNQGTTVTLRLPYDAI